MIHTMFKASSVNPSSGFNNAFQVLRFMGLPPSKALSFYVISRVLGPSAYIICRNQKLPFTKVTIMTSLMRKVLVVWLGRQNFFAVKVMKIFSTRKTLLPYHFYLRGKIILMIIRCVDFLRFNFYRRI